MPNVFAPHQKYDHFRNICGVIADPFEMFSNENQLDGP
jgi:hypothetical protein